MIPGPKRQCVPERLSARRAIRLRPDEDVPRSTYSAGELATRSRSKKVSYEIRNSRSSFDHDNSITKGAVIVDGSPDMRELSVAELRTSHGVPQGINER
jgi:hypothetical protein